jgi:SAM-dependent methyltransferase
VTSVARASGVARDWPQYVCPAHGVPLAEEPRSLVCPRGESFPVRAGIPRFVPATTYADAFGAQWRRFRLTQLDSHTGTTISADRIRRCLGDELWSGLDGRHVVECGCGAGRFTEILLARGARVTSVDLSEAVDANQANFPQSDAHRVAQADISALPFAPRRFDVAFCLGVLQHTPNPEAALAALYEQVRPGGSLVFDCYAHRLPWLLSAAPLFRALFRLLPPPRSLAAAERLVDVLLPLHRNAGRLEPLLGRFSPVVSYFRLLLELSPEAQREWAILDTHDALTDRYKHFRSPDEIRRTLERLGLDGVHVHEGGNGVEARGRRPES